MIEGIEKSAANIGKLLKGINSGHTARVKSITGHLANKPMDTSILEKRLLQPQNTGRDSAIVRLASRPGARYENPQLKQLVSDITGLNPTSPEYARQIGRIEDALSSRQGVGAYYERAKEGVTGSVRALWKYLSGLSTRAPETAARRSRIDRMIDQGGSNRMS